MQSVADPEFLTVSEAANRLRVSTETIIRWFADFPGVIDLGSPEDFKKRKRRYRALRIPQSTFDRFVAGKEVRR